MNGNILKRFGPSEATIGRYLVGAMAIGFVALLVAIGAAVWTTQRNEDHTFWVNHTYRVEVELGTLRALNEQAEVARRGYMLAPGYAPFLNTYRETTAKLPISFGRLAILTRDNPLQRTNLLTLRDTLRAIAAQREVTSRLVARGRADAAAALFRTDATVRRMGQVREVLERMEDEEHKLLALRDAEQRFSAQLFYIVLGVTATLLLLVALLTLTTILRFTRDITASRNALRTFNESLEEQVDERTADLSRANDEIQRFAYIVSHDLRAPLVNVMGFTAELDSATRLIGELIDRVDETAPTLVTEDMRLAAREDLPEAIGFIRSSSEKMDRLINAILKLSREGRRVLAPERLDMDSLVAGIRDSLQHRLDDKGTVFVIEEPLPRVVSDRLAIEQILSNLAENAVKYLQPGRPGEIVLRGRRKGARVLYEVEDNGRGIAPSDHQRVFDLFRRAGHQDQPGEGIGLAHVRALAYRLGGIIDVRSELGKGSVFVLDLPAALNDLQEDHQ